MCIELYSMDDIEQGLFGSYVLIQVDEVIMLIAYWFFFFFSISLVRLLEKLSFSVLLWRMLTA